MERIELIFEMIAKEGFAPQTLQEIDNYIKEIQHGREDFSRFNLSEHAGLCKGGAPLIGASIIACYATASITAGSNVESCQRSPANWEIDELQEKLIEQWAKAAKPTRRVRIGKKKPQKVKIDLNHTLLYICKRFILCGDKRTKEC